jgi:hypothetical protein
MVVGRAPAPYSALLQLAPLIHDPTRLAPRTDGRTPPSQSMHLQIRDVSKSPVERRAWEQRAVAGSSLRGKLPVSTIGALGACA